MALELCIESLSSALEHSYFTKSAHELLDIRNLQHLITTRAGAIRTWVVLTQGDVQ